MVAPIAPAESAFGGSMVSGCRLCVGVLGRNLASVAMKTFTNLIWFKKNFYKCTSNAICKNNAVINCISVQNKENSFPSTLTGHTTLVQQ
jgi:hypothetical protein